MITLVAAVFLAVPLAHANELPCAKNRFGHQGIKAVCQLVRNDGAATVAGFLLLNANGTKSYLKVVHTGSRAPLDAFVESVKYRVVVADNRLAAQGHERATLVIESDVENFHNFAIRGKTPGGRLIDTHGENAVESEALADLFNFTDEGWEMDRPHVDEWQGE